MKLGANSWRSAASWNFFQRARRSSPDRDLSIFPWQAFAKPAALNYRSPMEKEIDEALVAKLADVVFSEKDGVSEDEHQRRLDALRDHLGQSKNRRAFPSMPE